MRTPQRSFIVAANWKMHKSPREAVEFFAQFLTQFDRSRGVGPSQPERSKPEFSESVLSGRQVVFFVPAIDLFVTEQALRSSGLGFGAQNCHFEMKGAFTGENSPAVLAELGCTHALVGHSERRALFHETDEDTGLKVKALQAVGLVPMLCVGETLAQREAGLTDEVIVRQLEAGLALRDPSRAIVIAYEPVWAIGTGRVATPEQANAAHLTLRKSLQNFGGESLASSTSIVYGGSVKPENAAELARQPEVDGFLVGGASLEVASFIELCQTSKFDQ